MEPVSGVWRTEVSSFINFHRDVTDHLVKWDLKPKHQRDVIHTDKWQADIIRSVIMFKDIPDVYFFTRIDATTGLDYYVSLDGKQRCMAILRYMNNEYPYYPAYPSTMTGKRYNELSPLDQQKVRESKIAMKILSSDMSDEHIDLFFNDRQKTERTTLGEYLNAGLQYRSREYITDAISSPLFKPLLAQVFTDLKSRHSDLEMFAHMGYIYSNPESRIDPTTDEILEWWATDPFKHVHKLPSFYEYVRDTLRFLISMKVKRKGAKSVYKPFFKFMLKNSDSIPKLVDLLKTGDMPSFPKVGGDHKYTEERYNMLVDSVQ